MLFRVSSNDTGTGCFDMSAEYHSPPMKTWKIFCKKHLSKFIRISTHSMTTSHSLHGSTISAETPSLIRYERNPPDQRQSVSIRRIFPISFKIRKYHAHHRYQNQLRKISAIIESLPLIYREVLILKFLEEKSYEEIMDIVEKPKGTVASLINRGRKLLKEQAENREFTAASLTIRPSTCLSSHMKLSPYFSLSV